jgi:hypothetical protein
MLTRFLCKKGSNGDLSSVGFSSNEVDLESLRTRLRKMPDAELQRFGRARHPSLSASPGTAHALATREFWEAAASCVCGST